MPYFSKDQIEKARSIDLLTYLQTHEPTELIHVRGNIYCTREHDSLKISNGKWMWWSQGFGGYSALDYLIKVKGMSFIDAMKILTGEETGALSLTDKLEENQSREKKRKLLLPKASETQAAIMRYLVGRGIGIDIVKDCINKGMLYESLPCHNCVFVGFDENGKEAYAFFRSSNDGERLMGEAAGSDKRYAFRIDCASSTVHVFESAIDLLSYATIMMMKTGNWRAEMMVSLGGVYAPSPNKAFSKIPAALENVLQNHPEVKTIALHLDNDNAGKSATLSITEQLRDRYEIHNEPPPKGKDYNDYLMLVHYERLYKTKGDKANDRNRT